MADKWPVTTPMNWSSAADWNGGAKPQPGDDVYADGKTVTIDEDVTVGSIRVTQRSGGTNGGVFRWQGNRNIAADIYSSNSACVDVLANASGSFSGALYPHANGLYQAPCLWIQNAVNITLTISNEIKPHATSGQPPIRIYYGLNSTVNIVGNFSNPTGSGYGAMFIQNGNWGGNTGLVVNIVGNILASTYTPIVCADHESAVFRITGDVACGSYPAIISNRDYKIILNGTLDYGAIGTVPFATSSSGYPVRLLIDGTAQQTHICRVNNNGSPGVARSLYTGGQNLGQPDEVDVREGTTFGVSNEYTGTLAVPSPAAVSLGVPTDDTTGTLVVSLEDILAAGSQLGAGAWLVQLTFTDLDTGQPVQNANVRLSANGVGSRVVLTDVNGVAEFSADSATYDVTATANGYTFAPTTLVVAGNVSQSYDMTPASWPASAEPDSITLRYRVYDYATRQPVGANDAVVYLKIHTVPDVDGTLWQRVADSCSTDADGYVYFPNVPKASVVDVREGTKGDWRQITVPADATSPYDPEAILGRAYA